MIIKSKEIASGQLFEADVCVFGAGAAGITIALELGRNGIKTLLIPGGGLRYDKRYQDLYKGTCDQGFPLERSRQRRLGGTTAVWGGRCIPFDQIDFEKRSYVEHSGWPIEWGDIQEYYRRSQEYLDIGTSFSYETTAVLPGASAHFIEGFEDDVLLTNRVEKFSLPTNLGRKYYREFRASECITVLMDCHLVRLRYTDATDAVSDAICVARRNTDFVCKAANYVLAMGTFEVTRHLLLPSPNLPPGVGNKSGLLGRFFMTHFSGIIAEIEVKKGLRVINRYETDKDGIYCRRRLQISEQAQREAGILNFSSFLHHPPLEDPSHRNPLLSLLFLLKGVRAVAQKIPPEYSVRLAYGKFTAREYLPHIRNIVLGIHTLLFHAPELLYKRLICRRKLPSVIINNGSNRFSLHYHVEHAPHLESRLTLSDQVDEHGLKRIHVSLHYKDIDVASILKAHNIIKERLEQAGVGTLRFLREDPTEHIKEQIGFGGHQIGTTRMAAKEEDGVVDTNCKVFGIDNLYVGCPSVFPTAGQANPVLTIVAFAIRLADYLRNKL